MIVARPARPRRSVARWRRCGPPRTSDRHRRGCDRRRRAPSGDHAALTAVSPRNARGVPPMQRHEPHSPSAGSAAEPDLRSVAREPDRSHATVSGGCSSMPGVRLTKRPGAHLAQPDVVLTVAVGQERDEPAVGRDRRRPLPCPAKSVKRVNCALASGFSRTARRARGAVPYADPADASATIAAAACPRPRGGGCARRAIAALRGRVSTSRRARSARRRCRAAGASDPSRGSAAADAGRTGGVVGGQRGPIGLALAGSRRSCPRPSRPRTRRGR